MQVFHKRWDGQQWRLQSIQDGDILPNPQNRVTKAARTERRFAIEAKRAHRRLSMAFGSSLAEGLARRAAWEGFVCTDGHIVPLKRTDWFPAFVAPARGGYYECAELDDSGRPSHPWRLWFNALRHEWRLSRSGARASFRIGCNGVWRGLCDGVDEEDDDVRC